MSFQKQTPLWSHFVSHSPALCSLSPRASIAPYSRPSAGRRLRPSVAGVATLSVAFLTALVLDVSGVAGQDLRIPPDTVTTLDLTEVLGAYGSLGGVASDIQGDLYIANFRNAVWRIEPDGTTRRLTDAMYGSSGNAIDAKGDLYQSNFNANSIFRIRRTGEVEEFVTDGLNGPVGLTFGPDGDLYVANCTGNFISRVSQDGTVSTIASGGMFTCPNGLVFDDRGDLFVVNFSNTQLIRITGDGEASVFADIPGAGGNGHITFAGGAFYVTKYRGHSIHRVSRSGEASLVSGDGTAEILDGTAEVARHSYPNGITSNAAGNTLWVNEILGPQGVGLPTEVKVRRIRLITIGDVLAAAGAEGDVAAVESAWEAFHAERPWSESTADAVRIGYQFLSTARVAASIGIFELNAERHPDQRNALFHLGEAYRYTQQPDAALEQYRRVLAAWPGDGQAAGLVALLEGGL